MKNNKVNQKNVAEKHVFYPALLDFFKKSGKINFKALAKSATIERMIYEKLHGMQKHPDVKNVSCWLVKKVEEINWPPSSMDDDGNINIKMTTERFLTAFVKNSKNKTDFEINLDFGNFEDRDPLWPMASDLGRAPPEFVENFKDLVLIFKNHPKVSVRVYDDLAEFFSPFSSAPQKDALDCYDQKRVGRAAGVNKFYLKEKVLETTEEKPKQSQKVRPKL